MAASLSLQLYVWDRCFLLLMPSLRLPAMPKPRRRPSATLMLGRSKPFSVGGIGAPGQMYEGLLLAPGVARNALTAVDSNLMILDVGLGTPAYRRLQTMLQPGAARVLDAECCARLRAAIPLSQAPMDCTQADAALDALLDVFGRTTPEAPMLDPRIGLALDLIAARPLDELSLPQLTARAGLSESRLRALFQQQIGCAPTPYIRWAKTWQAMRGWHKGMTFTEAAHQAGFYDLAHIDHAFKELFGMNPSTLATASGVHFLHCGL